MSTQRPDQFTTQPAFTNYIRGKFGWGYADDDYFVHQRVCMRAIENLDHERLPQSPEAWHDALTVAAFLMLKSAVTLAVNGKTSDAIDVAGRLRELIAAIFPDAVVE